MPLSGASAASASQGTSTALGIGTSPDAARRVTSSPPPVARTVSTIPRAEAREVQRAGATPGMSAGLNSTEWFPRYVSDVPARAASGARTGNPWWKRQVVR